MFTDSLILTLTKKEHDFHSHQKQKRHEFERHLLLQHPKPFLLDLLFFGASKQVHRRYDVFIKARPDAVYLLKVPPLWQFKLSNLVFPAGALAAFFRVQQPEGADQYFFSADQGTKLPVTGAGFPSINCTFQLERWSSTYRWRLLPGFFFEQNHVRGLWIWNIIGALVIARRLID